MTREEMLRELQTLGLPRAEMLDHSDDYLSARLELRRKAVSDAADRRDAVRFDSHAPGGAPTAQDSLEVDPELVAMKEHFDACLVYQENYALAQPWKNGEQAATEAALAGLTK